MSEQEEIYAVFAQEAREQLGELEAGLLRMESGASDEETINAIFRAAHTIKGGSGVVELNHIEAFTHVLENLLDRLRNGEIQVSGDMVTDLLKGCDHLGTLLRRVEEGQRDADPALEAEGEQVKQILQRHDAAAPVVVEAKAEAEAKAEGEVALAPVPQPGGVGHDCWHISIRFGRNVLRSGMDPMAFLRYLFSLGEIVQVVTLLDALPGAAGMDPESCYLGFELSLRSQVDKAAIERVFDFVRDECELHILPPHSLVGDYIALIENLPEETLQLGEILVRSGALTREELSAGLARQQATQAAPPLGEILVAQHALQSEIVQAAAAKQGAVADKKATESRLIRVQADKLDELIDLVGEMVIAGAAANLAAQITGQTQLLETTSVLSRLVERIRDSALQLRMVQIGETFNRFQRVVRDVARELDKEIDLIITGADTQLDKSVVEKIGDPLMHLVRNAMDHGIEPASTRLERGKPARGRLHLNAYHDSGSVVIEVKDDGGGLNRARILAKAQERGLVSAGQTPSDHEICNLIFEPGFSTAERLTNLSGRGVGMDVVKRNIQALRGNAEISSVEGEGSTVTIRLPLTLAIIDGFLVGVGNASYVIPLEMIVECMELSETKVDRHYLNLRGEVLPFVRMRDLFDSEGPASERENVVVVKNGNGKAGIVVDALHGELQTVIKPLSSMFQHLRGIAGSTILGSGEVALILDVQALVTQHTITHSPRGPLISDPVA